METLKGLQENMGTVDGLRVANRGSSFFNHLATVADGIPMLGWVTVDPKPLDYVKEMMNSAQFYGNRVVKDYKEKYAGTSTSKAQAKSTSGTRNTSNGFNPFTPLAGL